jgi:hypothetical protein
MKKRLSILLLFAFLIPSVAFASWWNPLSWFNGWGFFHKTDATPQVQVETQITPEPTVTPTPTVVTTTTPISNPTPHAKKTTKNTASESTTVTSTNTDVADTINALANEMVKLANYQTNIVQNSGTMSGYTFGEYDVLGAEAKLSSLSDDILAYENQVGSYIDTIKSTQKVDKVYWQTTGIPAIIAQENSFIQQSNKILADFKDSKKVVQTQTSYTPPTSNYNSEYATKKQTCLNTDGDVRTEISSSGGLATESQVEASVISRMNSMGCFSLPYPYQVPTATCADSTYTYSQDRQGDCSSHGGVANWYPY